MQTKYVASHRCIIFGRLVRIEVRREAERNLKGKLVGKDAAYEIGEVTWRVLDE